MADSPRPMRIRLPTCRPMPAPATAPGAAPTPKANAPATPPASEPTATLPPRIIDTSLTSCSSTGRICSIPIEDHLRLRLS
ncbi:hypothetical protein C1882_10035 [Pseudomonas sp. FW305-E2]|nr:hypothetical protein C1882_10035 [Pseudomonas sp. FW305-E2]QNV67666.1 hypothetical protein F7661_18695 [Pseudomonas sp. CFA]